MTRLEIYKPKTCVDGGKLWRVLEVTPLELYGDINNVPVDKTYQNRGYRLQPDGTWKHIECTLKLQIEEKGFIEQRVHNLYRSSKKGYYCVVCNKKVYFTDEEIKELDMHKRMFDLLQLCETNIDISFPIFSQGINESYDEYRKRIKEHMEQQND